MPWEAVATQVNDGWTSYRFEGGRVRHRDGGGGNGICGCLIFFCACWIGAFVVLGMGISAIMASRIDTRGDMIHAFDQDVAAWGGGNSSSGSAAASFAALGIVKVTEQYSPLSTPISFNLVSHAVSGSSQTFGEAPGTITPWSSLVYQGVGIYQGTPSTGDTLKFTLDSSNKGVIGPSYTAPIVKPITLGNCYSYNNGCPSTWTYANGKCYEPASCYCKCTSGKHAGLKYQTQTSWGYNCLTLSPSVCGSHSSASLICYYEDAKPCQTMCHNQGGYWGSSSHKCSTFLQGVCLQANDPPTSLDLSEGCYWSGDTGSSGVFRRTKYLPVPPVSGGNIEFKLMSSKDPTILGAKLTDGCSLSSHPSRCFGATQAENLSRGLGMVGGGATVVALPCLFCAFCFALTKICRSGGDAGASAYSAMA